ncbi:MAG: DUF4388 domain-containing protein [Myxococcales bacterium]|nr:DUF4388 domain-containing protein [Myxococcales bacterium]
MATKDKEIDGSATRTRFAGSLADVSIGDLFQTLEMAAKSSTIDFETDVGDGTVWFQDREVVRAECAGTVGADAVYRLAMADEGTFVARFRSSEEPPVVHISPQRLLMESARRRDEWLARSGELRPANTLRLAPGASLDELDDDSRELAEAVGDGVQVIDLVPPIDEAFDRLKPLQALIRGGVIEVGAPPPASPGSSLIPAQTELPPLDEFWESAFVTYLVLGRGPRRALLRVVAINLMIISIVVGVAWWSGRVILGGQLLGWALLLAGHATSSYPQLTLRRPLLVLCEPLVVIADMLDRTGVKVGFVSRGRAFAERHAPG